MRKLAFFPTPYLDEDFRSVIFRYHLRAGNSEFFTTNLELFNTRTEKNPHIPRNLTFFLNRLPIGHELSLERILDYNTLWPLAKPFLTMEQIEQSMQEIRNGVEGARNFAVKQLSMTQLRILAPSIRYCPQCLIEDFDRFGECYVHRSHQIYPLKVCPLHQMLLISKCPMCGVELTKERGKRLLVTPNCSLGHTISSSTPISNHDSLSNISFFEDAQTIMESSHNIDRQMVLTRFQLAMVNKGYTFISGKMKKKELIRDIERSLVEEKSTEYDQYYDFDIRRIQFILHEKWNIQSLSLYLFLMRFLSGSVKEFLYGQISEAVPLPFSSLPRECVNKICPDYSKLVIKKCKREILFGNVLRGIFTCPTCGCTYQKRWALETGENQVASIINRGQLWESKFIELYTLGYNYQEISRELKTQRQQIIKWMERFQYERISSNPIIINEDEHEHEHAIRELLLGAGETAAGRRLNQNRLNYCRNKITKAIESGSGLRRRDINKLSPSAYIWLMKYDREWMERVLPKRILPGRYKDWQSIDHELAQRVREVAEKIYTENPAKRIARYVIINACAKTDKFHLITSSTKLPNAWAVVLQYEESKDDYLIRCVPVLVERMKMQRGNDTNVTLQSILSSRRPYHGCSLRVRCEIIKILQGMGFQDVERGMDQYLLPYNYRKKST
ncbi:TnsD family Tn7-like transposition protein [Brevibacillus porteri]|uniref:TnsD family Tn7-like transposition protein n=1 Tax=Brevibacillus porteri TaxID=2126350 RepID=UPI00362FE0E5